VDKGNSYYLLLSRGSINAISLIQGINVSRCAKILLFEVAVFFLNLALKIQVATTGLMTEVVTKWRNHLENFRWFVCTINQSITRQISFADSYVNHS